MTITDLAHALANDWHRYRKDHGRDLPEPMRRRLELLESLTRGSPLRCICLAGQQTGSERVHSYSCPARKI